jgi:hypothetical protein
LPVPVFGSRLHHAEELLDRGESSMIFVWLDSALGYGNI